MPRFLKATSGRDCDSPGFFDLQVDEARIAAALRGQAELGRLRAKTGLTSKEVVAMFTPGAVIDPGTGAVEMNAGYDPDHDEGRLEAAVWALVKTEAEASLAGAVAGLRPMQPGAR